MEHLDTTDNIDNTDSNTLPPPSATLLARWTLNPVQAAFLATDARFSFYVGGVGAGKTTAGALRALAWALDYRGSLGLIGAPTYPCWRDHERLHDRRPLLGSARTERRWSTSPCKTCASSMARCTLPCAR